MTIGYGLAFLAGVATFFATCLLPVLPVYIAYLGGLSVSTDQSDETPSRWSVFSHSIVFVFGFLLVFSMLGFAATAIGRFLAQYRGTLQKIGGVLIIIFGLGLMDIIRVPLFSKTYRFFQPAPKRKGSFVGAFLFGMTFGFAWVPCIGPVLATILFLVSLGREPLYGVSLLIVFALGLGLPFLVLGFFLHSLRPLLAKLERTTRYIQPIFGVCIILVGVLLMTDSLAFLSRWSLQWGGSLVL